MPERLSAELRAMGDAEFVQFIRETVERLHVVADYLEHYTSEEIETPEVGFESDLLQQGSESHEKDTQ